MISVQVVYATTDKIVIVNQPWWLRSYERITDKFCPCCKWRAKLLDKIGERAKEGSFAEKIYLTYYNIWNSFATWPVKKVKTLYEVPVDNACEAYLKIYKNSQPCHRDGCESCWELREDAMVVTIKKPKGKKWH